jgi:PKD repeat protein
MKKIIIILLLLITYSVSIDAQVNTACCPEFVLKFKRDADCLKTGSCASANGESNFTASMCKYSTNTFLVTPNLAGYTYAWTVTGGVFSPSGLTTATTNPATITWGGNGSGTITVTITSADGKCVKTIKENVCLRDAPKASFTFTPNNACAGTLINFSNTSTGGVAVSWDFGDGTTAGNVNNPTHIYAPVMVTTTYNVTITVYSDTLACIPSTQGPVGGVTRACCGCISTYTLAVTVVAGNALSIIPKDCINQCLCPGDTSEYCASKICAPYIWSVTGGTIISGAGTSCIKVKWGSSYPTSIQLVQTGCGNPCNDTSRLNVPVLVSGIPIMPNTTTVCQNSLQTYSLPSLPGAFYNWTITGGTIIGVNQNTPSITVSWGMGASGTVNCTYNNPLKPGCDGSTSLTVSIKPVLKINGQNKTCEGCPPITLFTGGAIPVSWSGTGVTCTPPIGTATALTFPITGVVSTYTITASSPAFCNSPQTYTVVVAPKPVLSITPSTVQTCPGTPVKFVATSSVTTGNITWVLPAGASMVANTGPQLDTAVIQFSTIPVGGATVTAEQLCAFDLPCSKGTVSATVTKPPVPIIAPSIINPCIDQTVNYVVSNAVPGVVYTWAISSTLGTITFGQGTSSINILWHGGSPNTATLTVSNCAGSSIAVPITVTMPLFPTISTSGTCIKTGITLTSSTGGPYLWNTGATTQSITVYTAGIYCVTINPGALGSCAQQKCITIPPNPYWVKIIPPCSVASCNINSLSVLLTVATNIGAPTGCNWMFDPAGGPVVYSSISTSCGNYTATALGSYYLIMTDANGCKDTSNIIRIPQDINICCTTPACSALSGTSFNFTHSGCQPTAFTGSSLVLPSGWTTGTLHPIICYGDGTSDDFISLNTTHQYAVAGNYTVCVVQKVVKVATNDTCCVTTCKQVKVPVVTNIFASYDCNTGKLTVLDNSTFYPNSTGAIVSWSYSGPYTGSFVNTPNQTQIITPTTSGNYTITLTVTLAGCTSTTSFTLPIVMPNCTVTATPNPSCDGAPVFFSTTAGLVSHYWQFGDGKFSYAPTPQHIYPSPNIYMVILTASTPDGCIVKDTINVTIQPKPIVTLTPKISTVCPNTPVTLTANINLNGNTMCSSYNLQWYNNGVAYGSPVLVNSFPVNLTVNNYGNFYAVLTGGNAGCNCVVTTDTVLVKWFPKPIAKIKGKSAICLVGGVGTVNLSNSVTTYATYNWSSNNPVNITFSPLNVPATTATITVAGNFQIFLEVIDINGCTAYDTLCIYATNSPTASINTPGGSLCAGNVYALTATPSPLTAPPAGYNYLWNNNASTQTINASAAGAYYAFVTDLNTGCSAITNAVVINAGPDLSLFPSCCDTICSDQLINISVPLPLAPGENICTKYGIVWLDNGVPISPQPSPCNILNTANLVPLLGMHNLSIAVTLNGCTDTSNVFNLYIKDCSCNCKDSHWGNIVLTKGEKAVAKNNKLSVADGIKLECKNKTPYVLECNKPFTINANYICKDTTCPSKVTYTLNPPVGLPISGNVALTYTPTLSGTYTVMLYGWCNNIKCDSCLITFIVKCDTVKNCCEGSHWKEEPYYYFKNKENPKPIKIDCNKETVVLITGDDCKKPLVVGAVIQCATADCSSADSVFVYNNLNNVVLSGPAPLSIASLPNGSYTVVINGYCGGQLCLTCKLFIKVDCKPQPPCDCKGSKWGDRTVTIGNTTQPYVCYKLYEKIKCSTPISVNANYICADPKCNGAVTYSLFHPSMGTSTGTLPLNFTPTQNGIYSVTIFGWCGGVKCDSCSIRIEVVGCDSIIPCCPYQITATPKEVTYTPNTLSTLVTNSFTISGIPATVNITEVRANVISYTIDDNFKGDCMKCVNLPFTWASTATATNIATASPKITMYGGVTVPSFNGSGAGAYQNPREVIWNNGTNLNSPNITNIGMSFILPPTPNIDCCELKGKICVKFTFRDEKCNECEAIGCFYFVIKKK